MNGHGAQYASVLLITSKAATHSCASVQDVVSHFFLKDIPMPASIISRIKTMATHDGQKSTMDFTDRHGQPLEDPDEAEDNMDQNDSDNDDATTLDIITGVDASNNPPGISLETSETPGVDYGIPGMGGESAGVGRSAGVSKESPAESGQDSDSELGSEGSVSDQDSGSESDTDSETSATTIEADNATSSNGAEDDNDEPPPLGDGHEISDDEEDDNEPEDEPEVPDSDMHHPDLMMPSIQRVHGLRPRKPRDNIHIHANVVHHASTQYSLKKL
jgi:hypothetical protein